MASEKQHHHLTSSITPRATDDEKSQLPLLHGQESHLPFPGSRYTRAIEYIHDSLPFPCIVILVILLFVANVSLVVLAIQEL